MFICCCFILLRHVFNKKYSAISRDPVSPEVFDLLNKLLKSDDENATGDAQLLCELFSGERVSYRYASEKTREIGCNVPFSIVGATQVPFAARLIARMDQGHGLLDRFLFIFPTCLWPSLQDTEDALSWLESQPLKSLTDVFLEMFEYHGNRKVVYKFTDSAKSLLNDLQSQEIHDINETTKEGNPPPKCKNCLLYTSPSPRDQRGSRMPSSA